MSIFLNVTDLPSGIGAALGLLPEAMIDDAEALAMLAAPCLGSPESLTAAQRAAVKAILRGAVMRWSDAGSGGVQTDSAGSLSSTIDTSVTRRGMFWPSEITSLQSVCADDSAGKAYAVDTVTAGAVHADTCSLNFGAAYCSCGADIAGFPLFDPAP